MARKWEVYWLSDAEWDALQPHLPQGRRGARRVDDRRVISGIMHMLRSGGRWKDCPAVYGPYTTIYNRWNRWSRQGVWEQIFYALTGSTGVFIGAVDLHPHQGPPLGGGRKRGLVIMPLAPRAAGGRPKSTR
jgi:transposase